MDHSVDASDWSDETAPTESWLFAQLIRGEHIPPIVNPEARARANREELERFAQFSSHHAEELSRIEGMHHDPLLSSRGKAITNWGHSWVVFR